MPDAEGKMSAEELTAIAEKAVVAFREHIEKTYDAHPTGCGGSFGELLCYEIHDCPTKSDKAFPAFHDGGEGSSRGLDFKRLAAKWGVSVSFLGELIADHCRRLEG